MHVACMMGANFSFVTINEKFTPRIIENVARYGLRERFAGANRMRIERITDLGPGFDNPEAQARILEQFNEAARKNTEAGAEVMALLAQAGVYETADGVPVLNGITNLVKLGEAAVKLNRIMGGRFTSKKCVYAPPPPDQIETFRKFYGADIYPTVKQP
jgi:allantoin racemase